MLPFWTKRFRFCAPVAIAAQADAEAGIPDIVITATRVATNLQATPIAITAVIAPATSFVARRIRSYESSTIRALTLCHTQDPVPFEASRTGRSRITFPPRKKPGEP